MSKHLKKRTLFTFLSIFIVICLSFFVQGCNYGGMVNLSEQIAIYQNLGFTKIDNNNPANSCLLAFVSVDQINQKLKSMGKDISVLDYISLALIKQGKVYSLLHLYYFNSPMQAKEFANTFKNLSEDLVVIEHAVLQKSTNKIIVSQSTNYYYFYHFYSSLKK